MLNNNGPLQNMWFSKGVHSVMSTIWGGTQAVKDYFSLKRQNDSLALENHRLYLMVKQYEAELAESHDHVTVKSTIAGNYIYFPAGITKISNGTQHNYMIIDKGSKDGVRVGCGVITTKGAVGIVDAVGSNYSYARSFKNHEMSVSARLGREGAIGPLSWDGRRGNQAILKEIPHHVPFEVGDTVFTSGFSSIFPPDIPLGLAGESKIVNGATYEIDITLFEDFSSLRYVTIVNNLGRSEINKLESEQ